MTAEQMVQYAYEEGFSAAAVVDTADIVFDPSFRPYCEENLCGQYGANYSCPPDCGTPEEMKQKVLAHKKALVLQSIPQGYRNCRIYIGIQFLRTDPLCT